LPDGSTEGILVASDPSAVDRSGDHFVLFGAADDYHARALVGGPHIAEGLVSASAIVDQGGIALLAQQTGPGHAIVGRLVAGEPARIEQLDGGATKLLCSGMQVTTADLAGAVTLTIQDGAATLGIGAVGNVLAKAS